VIAPYSLRANPLALVATPLTWEELNKKEYNPKKFDIETVFNRLQDKGDPLLSMYQEAANLKDAWRQLKKRVSHQLKKSA
jgi:bifunctional non-homologous end joining protein LigD